MLPDCCAVCNIVLAGAEAKNGKRVFVDGALVVNSAGQGGRSCGTRNLMPGPHDIRMESLQLGDGATKLTYSSKTVVAAEQPVPSVNELGPKENWEANTGYSFRLWINFPPLMPLLAMPKIYDQTPFAHGKLEEVMLTGSIANIVPDVLLPDVGGAAWDVAGLLRVEKEGPYTFCAASGQGMSFYVSNHAIVENDGPVPVVDCGTLHLRPGAYQIYAKGFSSVVSAVVMALTYFGPDTGLVPKPIPSVHNSIRPAPKNGFRMFLFENMPGKGTPSGMAWANPAWQQICNPVDQLQRKDMSTPTGCASYTIVDPTKGYPPPPVWCCFTPPLDQKGKPSYEFLIDEIKFFTPLDFILRAVGFGGSAFAYHIYGTVYVDKAGSKTICATCMDGCRIWFDDITMPKVISDNLKLVTVPKCKSVFLSKGAHPFLMDGFQNAGLAMAVVTMDGIPIRSVDAQLPEMWKGQVGVGGGLKATKADQKLRVSKKEPNQGLVEAAEAEAKKIKTPEEQSIFDEVLGILDLRESPDVQDHFDSNASKEKRTEHAGGRRVGGADGLTSKQPGVRSKVAGMPPTTAPDGRGVAQIAADHQPVDGSGEMKDATKHSLESTMAGLRQTRDELGKLMHNNGVLSNLTTIRPMTAKEREEANQRLEHLSPEEVATELLRRLRVAEQKELKRVKERRQRQDAKWKKQVEQDLGIGQAGPWGLGTWGPPKPIPAHHREAAHPAASEQKRHASRGRSLLYTTETKGGSKDLHGEVHPGFRYPEHKHGVDKTWGRYDLDKDAWGEDSEPGTWEPGSGSWKPGEWKDEDTYDDKGFPTQEPSFYYDGVRAGGKYGEWHDGWMDYWHDFHDDERKVAVDGDAWRLVHRDLTTPYITDWKPQFDPDHPDFHRITHGHGPGPYGTSATWPNHDDPYDDNCCGPQRLRPGAYLRSEDQLNFMQSYGDLYRFTVQEHGDLTMFYMGPADERSNGRGGGWTVWSSKTMYKGKPPYRLLMQHDCNLVLLDSSKSELWSSETKGQNEEGEYCSAILHENGVLTVETIRGQELWRLDPEDDPYFWVTRYKGLDLLKIPMTSSKA